jgi:transposase InsO family protein
VWERGREASGKKKEKEETVKLLEELISRSRLPATTVMAQGCFSRERLHGWRRGVVERRVREAKVLPEATVAQAAAVVARFPHLGGRKGQAYMAYHDLGVIGQKAYDRIRRQIKRVLAQELSRRPDRGEAAPAYEHVRPTAPGEVWAEDFTELPVAGTGFRLAVVVDVYDHYFLGWKVARQATAGFVGQPVEEALQRNGGQRPRQFLLSDNGAQYVSATHERELSSAEIVHRLIPPCVPQYNGTVESEMSSIKSVFYNVWEGRERGETDGKEKSLEERVTAALSETFQILNEQMPRPFLGGVTPADVHVGRAASVKERIRRRTAVASSEEVPPWRRTFWEVLQGGVKAWEMSTRELQTKLAFFGLRPLRRIAALNQEGVW